MKLRFEQPPPPAGTARSLLFALALLWVGCDPAPTIVLAGIEDIQPTVLEPGETLEITGEGFVEGPARITLEGEFDPFGLVEGTTRRVTLSGVATSESTLQVPITATAMDQLAREPLVFDGLLTVVFPAALEGAETRIGARREGTTLELRPAGGGIETEARRGREAEEILASLGIALDSANRSDELRVAAVEPGGPADQNGVAAGDHLLSIDSVPLAGLTDVAGLDLSVPHRFEIVTSSGEIRTAAIGLAPYSLVEIDEFAAIVLTAIALGVFMVFAFPRFSSSRRARRAGNPITMAVGAAVASIPLLTVPAAAILTRGDVGFTLALLGITVAALVISALYSRRKHRVLSLAARLLPVPIVLLIAGAQSSTFGLWNTVSSQESGPWGWHAWSNPFALLAILISVSLLWPRKRGEESVAARAADWVAAVTASMVVTAYSLGGWSLPTLDAGIGSSGAASLLLGSLVFSAKSWLVILAARWLAGAGVEERRSRKRVVGSLIIRMAALAGFAAGALAWTWSPISGDLEAAGRVLCGGVSLALATAFVASRIMALMSAQLGPKGPVSQAS